MAADGAAIPPGIFVVTPLAGDGTAAARFLGEAGLAVRVIPDLPALSGIAVDTIGCLVLVEEALVDPDLAVLQEALQRQPAWSDLPLVVMAREGTALHAFAPDRLAGAGNITLLQRPIHPLTLVSAIRVALRSRARQYQVRDLLAQRERALRQRDEFLAMLAHELRNPLAPIRNSVYLLGTLNIDVPLFAKCRALIDKQARHITRLVDDLLDVSRLERGKVQLRRVRTSLGDCAAAAIEAAEPVVAANRHRISLAAPSAPLVVLADAVRLEQVIGNLIVNAAKFTPEGGHIEVEVSREGKDGVVAVTDNGIGIKPEMLDTIFDLFAQDQVTLARSRGGLGIGLTLVKRLMEMHGGTVRARSRGPGSGARFEIRMPLQDAPAALDDAPVDAGGQPRRVLIVEDGADARETLGMLLQAWRHDVLYASDGPEGLTRAREARPDVMLVDIGLPGFDGYALARELRSEDSEWARNVKLIALTGYGQAADRARASEAGFDLHVLKPVDPVLLQRLVGESARAV